jgi:hypothetical protein
MDTLQNNNPIYDLNVLRYKAANVHLFLIAIYLILGFGLTLIGKNAIIFAVFLPVILIHFVSAWGLRQNKSWARLTSRAIGFLLLFGFPVGTLFGAMLLYYLSGKEWENEGF